MAFAWRWAGYFHFGVPVANTSAPLSEVAIASMACSLLAEYPLQSLDDDTPMARFMAREFGPVRDELLQIYPWHWAMSRAALPLANNPPDFGWTKAYNIPAGCLRLLPLRDGGTINGTPVPFELESGQVLTDYSYNGYLPIRYIRRETNPTKFSPLFARALANRLAMISAQRVTGKASYFQTTREAYMSSMQDARLSDSLERGTPESQYTSEVLSVRGA